MRISRINNHLSVGLVQIQTSGERVLGEEEKDEMDLRRVVKIKI